MPTVTRVDDSVSSGETFIIYGEGFDETSEVYVTPITSAEIQEYDDADNKTKCEIVSKNEENRSITVKLDESLEDGSYNAYVTNSYGASYAFGLNTARPQWVSSDIISNGEGFSVYGKNLSAADFDADNKSGISLVDDSGNAYDIPISSAEPYSIKCVLSNVPEGEYTVYATNDGYIWNECEDGRKLTVVEQGYDPYNIGASLAQNYNFTNVVNISHSPYYIKSGTDITSNIQAVINNVSSSGGGVVYLPQGEYYISSITLEKGVVLAGDGIGKTVLVRTGNSTDAMIKRSSDSSNTGVTDLSIVVPDEQIMPDIIVEMGYGFSQKPVSQQTISNVFLKQVSIKTKMTIDSAAGDGRGIGVVMGGKSHFVVEDCDFEGYYATITSSYVSEYTKINNNSIKSSVGNVSVVGEYTTITNNNIVKTPSSANENINSQGVFMRGFSYVSDNKFYDLGNKSGDNNDGEIICAEPYLGGTKLAGIILSAGADGASAVIDIETTNTELDYSELYYSDYYLCITDGRGIGQYSRIESFDEETQTVTLDKPFKVLPDTTSHFIISPLCENVTMYNNYCQNSEKGFWLYGDNVDCVIANNVGVNTEGVYIRAIYKDAEDDVRQQIGYFINVEDNKFTGTSTISGVCGIGVGANVESALPSMTYIYGVGIKNNTISDVENGTYVLGTEAPHINGIYVIYPLRETQADLKKIINSMVIENNKISDSDRGITISPYGYPNYSWDKNITPLGDMTDSIFVSNNSFVNVENEFIDERN